MRKSRIIWAMLLVTMVLVIVVALAEDGGIMPLDVEPHEHFAFCSDKTVCAECGQPYDGNNIDHPPITTVYHHDENSHWCECSCGEEEFNREGHRQYCNEGICILCGESYTGDAKKHRSPVRDYDEDSHWDWCETCQEKSDEEEHSRDCRVQFCSSCPSAYTGDNMTHELTQYDGNADEHWKQCTCGAEKGEPTRHSVVCSAPDQCEVCDLPVSGGQMTHIGSESGVYAFDGDQHWLVCDGCKELYQVGAHEGGEETGICSVCGYQYGEVTDPDPKDTSDPDASATPDPENTSDPESTATGEPEKTDEPEPTDTAEPEKTEEPEPTDTAEPEKTEEPEPTATTEPEKTEEPEPTDTAEPEKTEEPEPTATAEPEKTEEPEPTATAEPEKTEEPEPTATEEPEKTEEPEPTATAEPEKTEEPEPTATEEPESTPEPATSESPEPADTAEPDESPTPDMTDSPEVTDTPEETEPPEASETPEPGETEEPDVSETPGVSASPVPTNPPMRTKAPEVAAPSGDSFMSRFRGNSSAAAEGSLTGEGDEVVSLTIEADGETPGYAGSVLTVYAENSREDGVIICLSSRYEAEMVLGFAEWQNSIGNMAALRATEAYHDFVELTRATVQSLLPEKSIDEVDTVIMLLLRSRMDGELEDDLLATVFDEDIAGEIVGHVTADGYELFIVLRESEINLLVR